MAKTKISEWSTTPASNTDIDGINIAEGCAPSGINDAIRDLMSQVRSWQSGVSGDPFNGPMNGTIGATTAYSGAFTTVSATGVITSTLATGTAPLTIASTTKVTNLNADLLDGADWASPAALGSTTPAAVSATTLSASGTTTLSGLTASTALALDASKNVVSVANTGSGSNVLATSPTLVTPALGTPSSATLTNATGLPISTGVSGLGTGVATALAVNVGSAGAPVVNGGALGTPSSGTVTNLTGTASININGTVGATTPTTGAFTTVAASSSVTLSGGTANGVTYLNGSKVLTSGSALTFDGNTLVVASGGAAFQGTTAPSTGAGVEITYGAIAGAGRILSYDRTGATRMPLVVDGSYFAGYVGGSEQMRLTSTGLGIGTSSPNANAKLTLTDGTAAALYLQSSGAGGDTAYIALEKSTNGLTFGIENRDFLWKTGSATVLGGTERMRLTSTGNLGIGTSSPTEKLEVSGNAAVTGTGYLALQRQLIPVGQNGTTQLAFRWYSTGTTYTTGASIQATTEAAWTSTSAPARLEFSTTASGSTTPTIKATLDSSGNLGIGITSPIAKLAVGGTNTNDTTANSINIARFSDGRGGAIMSSYRTDFATPADTLMLSVDSTNPVDLTKVKYRMDTSGVHVWYGSTTSTERARIDSSGNLLVGTTSNTSTTIQRNTDTASAAISITSNTATTSNQYGIYNRLVGDPNNTTNYFLSCVGNATTRMIVYSNGNIQNTNNSYGAISDVKLKENIVDTTPKLADLMQVKVRNYNLIGDTTKQIGVVAQELEAVFPAMIDETPDKDAEGNDLGTTTKSVKYSVFVPMLIKALQEQQAIIESLKARLDAANL